jgi:hypothetical protein
VFLGVVAGGDAGFAGFDFDFFIGIAEQVTRMLQRVLGIAFEGLQGFTRLVRGIVLEAFQDLSRLSISASMLCKRRFT